MSRSLCVNVSYGILRIATAVNMKPAARHNGDHRACNPNVSDQTRSTAMEIAAMCDSAMISRKEELTLPPWLRFIATLLNSPNRILLQMGSSEPAGMSRREYGAISVPPYHGNSGTVHSKNNLPHRCEGEKRVASCAYLSTTPRLQIRRARAGADLRFLRSAISRRDLGE